MWPWIHLCLAHTAFVSPLLCLHCNWWGAYTEEALHLTLSAHCPSTHYCTLLCAKCACCNRRKSGSGQTSGECLTEVVSYTCEIYFKKSIFLLQQQKVFELDELTEEAEETEPNGMSNVGLYSRPHRVEN